MASAIFDQILFVLFLFFPPKNSLYDGQIILDSYYSYVLFCLSVFSEKLTGALFFSFWGGEDATATPLRLTLFLIQIICCGSDRRQEAAAI